MMIKGNERRVVIIKGDKDAIYDMACVFLRNDVCECGEDDIVNRAERIIACAGIDTERCDKDSSPLLSKKILLFFSGASLGCVISYATYLLMSALFFT